MCREIGKMSSLSKESPMTMIYVICQAQMRRKETGKKQKRKRTGRIVPARSYLLDDVDVLATLTGRRSDGVPLLPPLPLAREA